MEKIYKKFFQKTLDKNPGVCYTEITKREKERYQK